MLFGSWAKTHMASSILTREDFSVLDNICAVNLPGFASGVAAFMAGMLCAEAWLAFPDRICVSITERWLEHENNENMMFAQGVREC